MSGKRDRPRGMEIDEKTLEYKETQEPGKDQNIQSDQKIAQRTFFKIKTSGDSNKPISDAKPKFELVNNLSNSQKKLDQKKQKDEKPKQEKSNEQKNKQQSPKKQQKKPSNIFNLPSSTSNTSNIFSNFNNIGPGVGIFSNNPPTKNIFAKNDIAPSTNIFNNSSSAFGDGKPLGGSIFGTGQSIFGFSTNGVPPIKKQVPAASVSKADDQEDGGDSEELQRDQLQVVDKSKSTGNFEYKSDCETLFQHKATKVRKHNGQLVQNVEVIVQQDINKTVSWVTVRLAATKNSIVTGYLVKGKSQVKKIGTKDQNVTISILVKKEQTHQSQILKIQFQKPEEGKKFLETVQKLIK